MTVAEFIATWRNHALTERSAAQSHFIHLCSLVNHPDPVSADPQGTWFTFERGAESQLEPASRPAHGVGRRLN